LKRCATGQVRSRRCDTRCPSVLSVHVVAQLVGVPDRRCSAAAAAGRGRNQESGGDRDAGQRSQGVQRDSAGQHQTRRLRFMQTKVPSFSSISISLGGKADICNGDMSLLRGIRLRGWHRAGERSGPGCESADRVERLRNGVAGELRRPARKCRALSGPRPAKRLLHSGTRIGLAERAPFPGRDARISWRCPGCRRASAARSLECRVPGVQACSPCTCGYRAKDLVPMRDSRPVD